MRQQQFTVGQTVFWKAAGKAARLEGMAGKIVSGVVEGVDGRRRVLKVMPAHHKLPDAVFPNSGVVVDFDSILKEFQA